MEVVKIEKVDSDDDDFDRGGDDSDDDLDDEPLTKFATKVPKKESMDILELLDDPKPTKRKVSVKVKTPPVKKVKVKVPTKTTPKASSSKTATKAVVVKADKKKKGEDEEPDSREKKRINKQNVVTILECSKIYPFKWSRNLYHCFYCDEPFSDPIWLRAHHAVSHPRPDSFQIEEALRKIKKNQLVKADITDVGCTICGALMAGLNDLKNHLVEYHQRNLNLEIGDGILPFRLVKDDFRCVSCEARYAEFKPLNQHMNTHYQNFVCDQCGAGFMTQERLRRHALAHQTGRVPCGSCDKTFRSVNARYEHHAAVHAQVKRHKCPHCSESFRNYFQKNKHITTIHGFKTKEFKCDLCPKVFTLSGKLGTHVRSVHLKEKRYACNACEWKFFSKSELKDHMVRHGGERKHQCDVCKKVYARKYTLREHMRIHQDDRRFVCTACGKMFVQNCSLKHHVRVHHPFTLVNSLGLEPSDKGLRVS